MLYHSVFFVIDPIIKNRELNMKHNDGLIIEFNEIKNSKKIYKSNHFKRRLAGGIALTLFGLAFAAGALYLMIHFAPFLILGAVPVYVPMGIITAIAGVAGFEIAQSKGRSNDNSSKNWRLAGLSIMLLPVTLTFGFAIAGIRQIIKAVKTKNADEAMAQVKSSEGPSYTSVNRDLQGRADSMRFDRQPSASAGQGFKANMKTAIQSLFLFKPANDVGVRNDCTPASRLLKR